MVLGLEEVELLLDAVAGLAHRELEGLPRLRRTLQQTQHSSYTVHLLYRHVPHHPTCASLLPFDTATSCFTVRGIE